MAALTELQKQNLAIDFRKVWNDVISEPSCVSMTRYFRERICFPPKAPGKRTSSRKKKVEAVYLAYDFVGDPTKEQQELFRQTFGCCRWYWNHALSDWKKTGNIPTSASYKKDREWLRIPDSLALANVQLSLEAAVSDYLSGEKGRPRYKKKGLCRNAYTTNNQNGTVRLGKDFLVLPKAGPVRVRIHRPVEPGGILKRVTVSQEPNGRWMFSVVVEYPVSGKEELLSRHLLESIDSGETDTIRAIGLDMSLPKLYIDSDGNTPSYTLTNNLGTQIIPFAKHYQALQDRIAREQRKLSHMVKKSKNYQKQCTKIAKLHAKAKHQRHDFLRQMAIRLARAYDVIAIEDLDLAGMKKALKFGKSVSDNSWGAFTQYLEESCRKTGSVVIRVDKWFPSSRKCHMCGYVNHELTLSDRTYVCPVCGNTMDRDAHAAVNIRDEALRILGELQVESEKNAIAREKERQRKLKDKQPLYNIGLQAA